MHCACCHYECSSGTAVRHMFWACLDCWFMYVTASFASLQITGSNWLCQQPVVQQPRAAGCSLQCLHGLVGCDGATDGMLCIWCQLLVLRGGGSGRNPACLVVPPPLCATQMIALISWVRGGGGGGGAQPTRSPSGLQPRWCRLTVCMPQAVVRVRHGTAITEL